MFLGFQQFSDLSNNPVLQNILLKFSLSLISTLTILTWLYLDLSISLFRKLVITIHDTMSIEIFLSGYLLVFTFFIGIYMFIWV